MPKKLQLQSKFLKEIEDLKKEIKQLKSRKKYGLVWEDKPEQVVDLCKEKLPVLIEDKSKEIKTDPAKPTNILIEGDNYHALSVLNYTHQGKIDVICIDPPYNTGKGKEWKFNDRWVDLNDNYRHSKWLSFFSKRLIFSKNLLSTRGVILISIDDNEYATLKLLCDEIFGEKKYVGTLVWEKKKKGSHLDSNITNIKEYVLVYHKGAKFSGLIGVVTEKKETYPCINPGNGYSTRKIPKGTISNYAVSDHVLKKGKIISAGNMKLILHSDLIIKDAKLKEDCTIEAEWRYSQNKINEFAGDGSLYLTRDLYLRRVVTDPRSKKLKDLLPRIEQSYLNEVKDNLIDELLKEDKNIDAIEALQREIKSLGEKDFVIDNLFTDGWGSNEDADNEQRDFFGKKVFDYPKPSKLIKKLIASTRIKDGIVLDFFGGTGTTGQAVLELNQKGFNLKFILCTNNEDNNDDSLKIATDICYPRIEKVIKGYKKRDGKQVIGLNGNLKYFKTDFVDAEPTDQNKKILVDKSAEMLCLKEDCFEKVKKGKDFQIFKNNQDKYLGIIYDDNGIEDFKKEVRRIDKKFIVYVFSLDESAREEEFEDMENLVELKPIPAVILNVYKRIFK